MKILLTTLLLLKACLVFGNAFSVVTLPEQPSSGMDFSIQLEQQVGRDCENVIDTGNSGLIHPTELFDNTIRVFIKNLGAVCGSPPNPHSHFYNYDISGLDDGNYHLEIYLISNSSNPIPIIGDFTNLITQLDFTVATTRIDTLSNFGLIALIGMFILVAFMKSRLKFIQS